MNDSKLSVLVEQVADLIVKANKVVVFTGAGHSTESGIPDFRSPGGIWDRFDPRDFTYQKFLSDPEGRKTMWRVYQEGLLTGAKPNNAHYAVTELYKMGRLDCVITQNIDHLHQKSGIPDDRVFELHGNNEWIKCLSCGKRYPFDEVKIRLDAGEESPDCEVCHGLLKPEVVFFGESLPVEALQEASERSSSCDLFIVIGSSLVVYPAAYMPSYAVSAGAKLVILNLTETPMDGQASVMIRAKAGEILPLLVERVKAKVG